MCFARVYVCVRVCFSPAFREQGNMTDVGGQAVRADNFPIKLTKWCPLHC
jgi:hypothetical protein